MRLLLLVGAACALEGSALNQQGSRHHGALYKHFKPPRLASTQMRGGAVGGAAAKSAPSSRGAMSVCGGAMTHLVLGSLYCWGNFMAYAPKHLQFYDGLAHPGMQPDALAVLPITILFQCLFLPVGTQLSKKYGPRKITALGGLMVAGCVFAASFANSLKIFTLLYAVGVGAGIGTAYTSPMSAGWTWFPEKKGFVNGLTLAGFGSGGFFFNLIGTRLANPHGLAPVAGVGYPASVYSNFAPMLRRLSALYAVLAIVGSSFVKRNPDAPPPAPVTNDRPNVLSAVKSPKFIILWLVTLLTASAGLTIASLYKVFAFGIPKLADDTYLATAGALGTLSNGFSRLVWGLIVDAYGFKGPFKVMLGLQAATLFALPRMANAGRGPYLAAILAVFTGMGGVFSMVPTCVANIFGQARAADVYSIMFTAFASASLGGVNVAKQLIPKLGWDSVFKLLGGSSLLALFLVSILDTTPEPE